MFLLFAAAITGIIATFTFSAINTSSATGGAIGTKYPMVKNVSDNAIWRDIGTAVGAFIGGLLLPNFNVQLVLVSLLFITTAGLFYYGLKIKIKAE